ncbi:MAG: hypothetical protein R3E95_03645 [Thiolinea sp.]
MKQGRTTMEAPKENKKSSKNYQSLIIISMALVSHSCEDAPLPSGLPPAASRPIATLYKVRTDNADERVPCYHIDENGLDRLTRLRNDQIVEIVDIRAGLRRYQGDLWLHVYPRLSHRPSCYVNVDNLIPYR